MWNFTGTAAIIPDLTGIEICCHVEKLQQCLIVRALDGQKYMFTYHVEGQIHFMFILYLWAQSINIRGLS